MTGIERAIRGSYLAQGFSERQFLAVTSIAQELTFLDGENILQQFDHNRDLFILVEGHAQILTMIGDAIGIIREGMPIGEISFLDGKPRSVSVVSVGQSLVARLPHDEMKALLEADPSIERMFLRNISSVLCARLRSANNNIAALLAIEECASAAQI